MKPKKAPEEFIALDQSDNKLPALNEKGKVRESQKKPCKQTPYKSVEFIDDESEINSSHKQVIDIDIDSDNPHPISTLNPALFAPKVYCANAPEYWKGEIELPEGLLSYLGLIWALEEPNKP